VAASKQINTPSGSDGAGKSFGSLFNVRFLSLLDGGNDFTHTAQIIFSRHLTSWNCTAPGTALPFSDTPLRRVRSALKGNASYKSGASQRAPCNEPLRQGRIRAVIYVLQLDSASPDALFQTNTNRLAELTMLTEHEGA
jgi:hypothetical protein